MIDLIVRILENLAEEVQDFSLFSPNEVNHWTDKGYYVIYEIGTDYYQIGDEITYESIKKIISIHETYEDAQRNERLFQSIACP